MEIDSLIRDLDTLGVRDELEVSKFKTSWLNFSGKDTQEMLDLSGAFNEKKEYAAALKWNDNNEIKITGFEIYQEITSDRSKAQKLIGDVWVQFGRAMWVKVSLSNGKYLKTRAVSTKVQEFIYYERQGEFGSPDSKTRDIENCKIKLEHINQIGIPSIEFLMKHSEERLVAFRDALLLRPRT